MSKKLLFGGIGLIALIMVVGISLAHAQEADPTVVTEPTTDVVVTEPVVTDTPLQVVDQPTDTTPDVEVTVLDEVLPVPDVEVVQTPSAPAPELTTDKADYFPGETATIWGKFFTALQNVSLTIVGQNEDGTQATASTWDVTADDAGAFTTYYHLINSYVPLYMLAANSDTGEVLATTTFTDAKPPASNVGGFDKSGYDKGTASWGTGNQSGYSENDWVQYQYSVTGITDGPVPSFNIIYDEQVSNRIFIDGFSNFRFIVDAPYATASSVLPNGTPRPVVSGWTAFTPLNINNTHSGSNCNTTDSLNTPTAEHCFRIDPTDATFVANNPTFPTSFTGGGTHKITIFYEAHMAATFVWSTGNENKLRCQDITSPVASSIYCAFAPTGAVPANTTFGTGIYSTWTTSSFTGAGGGGSNKHFNLADASDGPSGAITLPIPAVTLPAGSITITKVTSPTPATGVTFPFTSDFGQFTLDTDASATNPNSKTFGSLPAGIFNFTEAQPVVAGWGLTNITCVTNSGTAGSTFQTSTATGLSTINLASGAVVTCTYTNSITQVAPTFTTTIHDANHGTVTSVPLGSTVHDSASVTGSNGTAIGSVTFYFFGNGVACPTSGTAGGTLLNAVALNGSGVADPSTAQGPLAAGSYNFKATYPGDAHYLAAESACEPLTVNKGNLTLATTVHTDNPDAALVGNAALNTSIHDSAQVTGIVSGFAPANSVTFTFFNDPATGACTGSSISAGSHSIDGTGLAHPSSGTGPLGAGDYAFRANLVGDSNYTVAGVASADSACEPFTVNKAQLGINTTVHNDSGDAALVGNLPLGGGAHDSASVTGKVDSLALPDVTFYFFGKGVSCVNGSTTGATQLNTVTPNGSDIAHPSTSQTNLAAGNYNFMAVVGSNSNYDGATSNCEPFTVNKAQLTVNTTVHQAPHVVVANNGHVALGTVTHDNADVTGEVSGFAIPAISFTLNAGSVANAVSAEAGFDATSVDSAALAAGNYTYSATVAGNDNYLGDTSDPEPFVVDKAQLAISTDIHNAAHSVVTSVGLGSVVHDTATVTGAVGGFTPTGAVSFTFDKSPSVCGTSSIATAVALDGGKKASVDTSALTAGSYNFQGAVAGDDNYLGATSSCEPLTVNKASLSISTTIHDAAHATFTTGPLGSVVHDTASVSGQVGSITPTGAVTFYFGPGVAQDCKDPNVYSVIATSGSPDAGTGGPRSVDTSALGAGNYQFWAHVAGDDNYTAANSDCEPLTINKAKLEVSTIVHNSGHAPVIAPVALGSVLHDTATLTGAVDGFTVPTPTFSLTSSYTNDCSQGTAVGNDTDEAPGVYKSVNSAALGAGNYAYRAVVGGNANYDGDTGDCEPFTVSKGTLAISTTLLSSSPVALGGSMQDSATVTGIVSGFNPTNPVNFLYFTNGTCAPTGAASGSSAVTFAANTVNSTNHTALAAGSYAFNASIAGDSNYDPVTATSDCEPFTVNKADTSTVTEIHKDGGHAATLSVDLGDSVHDKAVVSTQVGNFVIGGNVTFTFYTSGDCTEGAGTPEVVAVGTESSSSGSLGAGSYSYKASYGGDANYKSSVGDCEPLTVNKANSSTVTEIHKDSDHSVVTSVALGSTVHDQATVTGVPAFDPTGNVEFMWFTNDDCEDGSASGTVALDVSGVAHPSDSKGPLGAGSYSFQAHYVGDANYKESTGDCEPLTVNQAQLTVTTTVHDASHTVVPNNGHVALGTLTHDNADVTGEVAGFPIGAITFTLNAGAVANDTAEGSFDATSVASGALGAGSYTYSASVASNANYLGATSDPEPFVVDKAQLAISTDIHNAGHGVVTSVPLGSIVHDTATVTGTVGGFTPTGAVSFTFDTQCPGSAIATDANLDSGKPRSVDTSALAAGSYNFQGTVASDANYLGATSSCEPLTVNKAQLNVTTIVHNNLHANITNTSVPINSVVHDTATVTGGVNSFALPAVSFTLTSSYVSTCANGTEVNNNGTDGGAVRSADSAALTAGAYAYRAVVAGDANYLGATGACEPFRVSAVQGCSPGYWKNHPDSSWPSPYHKNTLFSSVFENAFPGKTLQQVLEQGGGGLNALGRIIVSALLNSAKVSGFQYTPQEVINAFNAVFPGGNYDQVKNQFEALQDPCPFN